MRKGVIWVAAVLYIGIGIVAIGLILSAALPAIGKLKDRNTYAQTKELFFIIDENIRKVVLEGPGSQRELSPLTVSKGQFNVNETSVSWSMRTEALVVEPSDILNKIIKKEGNVKIWQDKTGTKDEYVLNLLANYDKIKLQVAEGSAGLPLLGTYTMLVKNTGEFDSERIIVSLTIS